MQSSLKSVENLRTMLDTGVFLDPLLTNNFLKNTDNVHMLNLRNRAREIAAHIYANCVHEDTLPSDQILDRRPFSPSLMRLCLVETLISTAFAISHEEYGLAEPGEAALGAASERLTELIAHIGCAALYNAYFTIAGYDTFLPLYFHKDITEQSFLAGTRHHPYLPENLELFLLIGLSTQTLRLKRVGQGRTVQITRLGVESFHEAKSVMRESGYFDKRVKFAYLYSFDTVEDWDAMCDVVWPNNNQLRKTYIASLGDLNGKRVLEVACGTGALTFDAKLYEQVGPTGELVALDLSTGMLDQARRKWERLGEPANVTLQLGNVERMSFPDASFDICLGVGFLHFVDPVITLREMARTVVNGGTVSVWQGSYFALSSPFFRDWFEPIFALARRRNAEQPENYMPENGETIVKWFEQAGLRDIEWDDSPLEWLFDDPEIAVQHLLRGVSFFEAELMELPWDDRRTIVAELVDRGHDVCARYPLSQRTIRVPMHNVKGRVVR